jgi:hypothetical protein
MVCMFKPLVPALCLCLLAAPAWSQTEAASDGVDVQQSVQVDGPEFVPEKILVVGQRPGPGLWKISKGGHVLWVFGSYSPLPKNMEWRSQQVETILAQSQEYLLPPSATAQVGFFRMLTLLPYGIGFKKNPDGAQLRDLLSPDVHARWLLLKAKYIGADEGIERNRPIFVAEELFRQGLVHAGLSSGQEVRNAIEEIAKSHKIKMTSSAVKLAVDDPVRTIKDFKKSSLDDIACFTKTIERLETDIDAMRLRANAWAKGDLEGIQKLSYADRDEACSAALTNSMFVKNEPGFQSMDARMRDAWLASAEKSLATNASTFAMLPLHNILDPKGYVTALQAKGYLVEAPE